MLIDVIKVFDDKEAEKKTLEEAKRCNWRQCPSCGHLVERTVINPKVLINAKNLINLFDRVDVIQCAVNARITCNYGIV